MYFTSKAYKGKYPEDLVDSLLITNHVHGVKGWPKLKGDAISGRNIFWTLRKEKIS